MSIAAAREAANCAVKPVSSLGFAASCWRAACRDRYADGRERAAWNTSRARACLAGSHGLVRLTSSCRNCTRLFVATIRLHALLPAILCFARQRQRAQQTRPIHLSTTVARVTPRNGMALTDIYKNQRFWPIFCGPNKTRHPGTMPTRALPKAHMGQDASYPLSNGTKQA